MVLGTLSFHGNGSVFRTSISTFPSGLGVRCITAHLLAVLALADLKETDLKRECLITIEYGTFYPLAPIAHHLFRLNNCLQRVHTSLP